MAMVNGTKHWHLFHPDDTKYLYAKDESYNGSTIEEIYPATFDVDTFRPDFEIWPDLRKATVYNASISKGDILFIPEDWPHQVYNPGPTVAFAYNYVDDHNMAKFKRHERKEARDERAVTDALVKRNEAVHQLKSVKDPAKSPSQIQWEIQGIFNDFDEEYDDVNLHHVGRGHHDDRNTQDAIRESKLWPQIVVAPASEDEHFREWFSRNKWKWRPYAPGRGS